LPRSRARRTQSLLTLIVAGLPLAACLGTGTAPSVTSLDGAYAGEFVRSGNSRAHCPIRRKLSISISGGELRGEIVAEDGGSLQTQRFAAFVESGGTVTVPVRIGDLMYALEGRLDGRAFRGEARSEYCTMSAFARRADGA
jgi:hypothetical protein